MHEQFLQGFTYTDYPIQCSFNQSTSLKGIDTQIIQEDTFSSILTQKRYKAPSYYNISSLFQIDTKLIHLQPKKLFLKQKKKYLKLV